MSTGTGFWNGIHNDGDVDGEVFRAYICCQADLVGVAIELGNQRDAEGCSA